MVEYTPILALFLLIAIPSVRLTGLGIEEKFCKLQAAYLSNRVLYGTSHGGNNYSVWAPCGVQTVLGPDPNGSNLSGFS